jgi:hypothetical protein
MKRHKEWMILSAIGIILAGCVSTTKEIARMTTSTRTDVFVEVTEGNAPPGFVDLVIKTSIKISLEEHDALESKTPAQKKPGYLFLLNIDGQAVLWIADGQKETIPLYDENGKTSHDPDAGTGMKYALEKKVRLAPGPHAIFFGIPGEPYFTVVKVSLKEGVPQVLEFKPHYRYKTIPTRIPTFLFGINSYEAMLDGQVMRRDN